MGLGSQPNFLASASLDARISSATALARAGRYAEAETALRLLAVSSPAAAAPHYELGALLRRLGRYSQAEQELRRAWEIDRASPIFRHALGNILLCLGQYEEAWNHYDARHEIPQLGNQRPRVAIPEWMGEDIAGKHLVIFPEQGLGDQIQAARFIAPLRSQGAKITLFCAPPLTRLFAECLDARVVAATGKVNLGEPDLWTTSGALAARLNVTVATIPGDPYLRGAHRRSRQGDGLAIGLMTQGNPNHVNDANRSLGASAEALRRSLPGDVINLAPSATGARDFADTAEIVDSLDLVISVDTSVAHLAGAMGKPCWTLLSAFETDWRWMADRPDSPWYPSMRLYRQSAIGDWSDVIEQVRNEVAKIAAL